MKVIFDSEKEFENFKGRKCPCSIDLKARCMISIYKNCEECWEESLKDIPKNIEIEVKEDESDV